MKNLKLISILGALLILTGCGGGGSGSGANPPSQNLAVALSVLSNGQGIARISGGAIVGLVFSPQIATVVQDMNTSWQSGNSSSVGDLNPSNFPVVSTTATTETRKGTITSDGVTVNATILKNNATNNATGRYIEIPGDADILIVVGDSSSNIPTTGTATFTGVFTQNARSVIAPGQLGTFSLSVNYSASTFTLNATSTSAALSGSGTINLTNGLFASSDMAFSVNGARYTANLYGNLNGGSATSVSGLFFTNDSTPDYAGSFIGSR